jgi:hypothetical protein
MVSSENRGGYSIFGPSKADFREPEFGLGPNPHPIALLLFLIASIGKRLYFLPENLSV